MTSDPLRIPPEAAGERLDAFLAERLGSRSRAQRLIEEGRVLVDGEDVPKRRLLRGGELLHCDARQLSLHHVHRHRSPPAD